MDRLTTNRSLISSSSMEVSFFSGFRSRPSRSAVRVNDSERGGRGEERKGGKKRRGKEGRGGDRRGEERRGEERREEEERGGEKRGEEGKGGERNGERKEWKMKTCLYQGNSFLALFCSQALPKIMTETN